MNATTTRIAIVDDQAEQRAHLKDLLKLSGRNLVLVGEYDSIGPALEGIEINKPELLFLDVMLHPGTGFDLLNGLGDWKPSVIFTTSYQEFALRALRLSAVDYLLKPFGITELCEAFERYESRQRATLDRGTQIDQLLHNSRALPGEEQICVTVSGGLVFLQVRDIIRMESSNVNVVIYAGDSRSYVTALSLKDLESMLAPSGFMRVHQSHLVNLRAVRELRKGDMLQLVMSDDSKVDVSRRKKEEVVDALKAISL